MFLFIKVEANKVFQMNNLLKGLKCPKLGLQSFTIPVSKFLLLFFLNFDDAMVSPVWCLLFTYSF